MYYDKKFERRLHLGNSIPGSSEAGILALQKLLGKAIDLSSGLQQPDHPTSDEHAEQCELDRRHNNQLLENYIGDIAMALTGREIVFKGVR